VAKKQLRQLLLKAIELCNSSAGRPWRKFYAWMLDWNDRKTTLKTLLASRQGRAGRRNLFDVSRGQYHVEFMKRHGLRPQHRVFDFGCGYGRTAVPLLRYLESDRYIGADLSAERIRISREFVASEALEDRKPRFIASDDIQLSYLDTGSIDLFWAQSVFTHMPESDVIEVLRAMRRVLATDGMALINYATMGGDAISRVDFKDFYYPEPVFERMVKSAGFEFAVLEDWEDDLPGDQRYDKIRVLKLQPSKSAPVRS
jgi:ubiquinone/menaquinone biosynthesis C-methylase UbiE